MPHSSAVRIAIRGAGVGFFAVFVSELVIHLVAANDPYSELWDLTYALIFPYKWIALELDLVRPPNIVAGLAVGVCALIANSVIAGVIGAIAALSIRKCRTGSRDVSGLPPDS